MKKSNLILLIWILFANIQTFAQNNYTNSDSVFIITISTNLPNGSSISSSFVIKEFSKFTEVDYSSVKDFVCSLSTKSIYLYEPLTGFTECLEKNDNEAIQQKQLSIFLKQLKKLNKSVINFGNIQFIDNSVATIEIAFAICSFYEFTDIEKGLNSNSNDIKIENICYKQECYFKMKEINKVLKITKPHLSKLRTLIKTDKST